MMNKTRLFLALTVIALLVSTGSTGLAAQPKPTSQPGITYKTDGLLLDWQFPEIQLNLGTDGLARVYIPGFESDKAPGQPDLPARSFLIALPEGSEPSFQVLKTSSTPARLAAPLATNAIEKPQTLPDGTPFIDGLHAVPETLQPSSDLVELSVIGVQRGVRLARLTLRPAHLEADRLVLTSFLQLDIRFNALAPSASSLPADPILQAIQESVINPAQVGQAALKPQAVLDPQASVPQAVIEVSQTGLYRLTYAALQTAGYPLASANPNNFRLVHAGQVVSIELEEVGASNNRFEPGEAVLFFANPRFSRWANFDTYLLSEGVPSPRVVSLPAAVTGQAGMMWLEKTFESNAIYTPECYCAPVALGRDGDRWVWDTLNRAGSPTKSYTFTIENPNPAQPAVVTAWLIGNTDIAALSPDHRVQVSVNNQLVGSADWNGKQAVALQYTIPAGMLAGGNNTLTLNLPGISGVTVEGMWLDAFKVRYAAGSAAMPGEIYFSGEGIANRTYTWNMSGTSGARVYDVSNEFTPVRYSGFSVTPTSVAFSNQSANPQPRFLVTTDAAIHTPGLVRMAAALQAESAPAGATYIIISPDVFTPALTSLISLRQGQGFGVLRESLQAIYDRFGEGRPLPEAIRNYLQQLYTTQNPKPLYVLLVGDGTADPKKYWSSGFTTFIPPYLVDFDPWSTEGSADNRFATLDGPADILPELAIGRLPVNDLSQAQALVNKIVQYETNPATGTWKNNASFVAARPDYGGDFGQVSYQESAQLGCTAPVSRFYFLNPYQTVASLKQALIAKWNSGTNLIVFNGHAHIHAWATRSAGSDNFEEIFHANDIAALTNGSKLPVVLSMTCFTSSYQNFGLQSLDEQLVTAIGKGALATWGSTSKGISNGHQSLTEGFIRSVITQKPTPRLGLATIAGKLNMYAAKPSNAYLIDSFALLGDPGSVYTMPDTLQCTYVPKVIK